MISFVSSLSAKTSNVIFCNIVTASSTSEPGVQWGSNNKTTITRTLAVGQRDSQHVFLKKVSQLVMGVRLNKQYPKFQG